MNRYPKTSQSPSLEDPSNLTIVRAGLTTRPQNTLADLKVRTTPYSLEVQFAHRRIRDGLVFGGPGQDAQKSLGLSLRFALATVAIVGGAVAITGSAAFGIVMAAALPVLYKVVKSEQADKGDRTVTLRFVNAPDGRTLLSMTTVPSARTRSARSIRPTVHFSNQPIRLVAARTYLAGGQVSLMLYQSDRNGRNKLRITGSRQETRWLHARLSKWNKAKDTAA